MFLRFDYFLVFLFLFFSGAVFLDERTCSSTLSQVKGGEFLHRVYPELHSSEKVLFEQERIKQSGEKGDLTAASKIARWLSILERTHLSHRNNAEVFSRLKQFYYKDHVIKEGEIPESYFTKQKRLLREQGYGDIELRDSMRHELASVIIADQKSSLDAWLEELLSLDFDGYPMWVKYWVMKGMIKLSTFQPEKQGFGKREKGQIAPYPELNREALAYVMDQMVKKVNESVTPEDVEGIEGLLQAGHFGKLYAWALKKFKPKDQSILKETKGRWVKYDRGSDHMLLVESLQGQGTGWCTSGEETAKTQLGQGDFYVYYSQNASHQPTVPRIAIRMQQNNIAEVRGVGKDQNIDPFISETNILSDKLKEFGEEGEKYQKKFLHMKRLTLIDDKSQSGEEVSREELRFLYELDENIVGFGYNKDPRISEIILKRDKKRDLSYVLDLSKDQISLTREEALKGQSIYHYKDLDLSDLQSAEGLVLPQSIGGDLDLSGLESAEGLTLPQTMEGGLYLYRLASAEGLTLPQSIGGSLNLSGLKSAEDLILPQSIGGILDLRGLKSAEGLVLPQSMGGHLYLMGLASAEGLNLPQTIVGGLYLFRLASAEGLTLPRSIGGYLDLSGLESAEGLTLPIDRREMS